METRAMEISLISARDLNNAVMFSKAKAFAVAWISDNYKCRQWTPVDQDNGTDPTWNQVMNFTLNEVDLQQGRLHLEIEIFTDTILGDKEIGSVSVPLKEFLKPAGSNKGAGASPQFVSYQVRKPNGKGKGVLNLSVKLAEKTDFIEQQQPLQADSRSYEAAKAEAVTLYPAGLDVADQAESVTSYPAGLSADFMHQQHPLQAGTRSYGEAQAESVTSYPAGAKSEPVTAHPSELNRVAKAEPVTAYPGYPPTSSSSYQSSNNPYYQGYPPTPHDGYPPPPPPPPYHGYPPPPHHGHSPPPPPPHHGHPPPPPPPHHGYPPPPPPHHGYPPPPPPHHGYPPHDGHPPYQGYPPNVQSPRKNNKSLGWLWGQA